MDPIVGMVGKKKTTIVIAMEIIENRQVSRNHRLLIVAGHNLERHLTGCVGKQHTGLCGGAAREVRLSLKECAYSRPQACVMETHSTNLQLRN
jgi:hypothetical protein